MVLATLAEQLRSIGAALGPWLYLVVFVVAALEASVFVGLVIPGETVLLIAGVLCWQGHAAIVPAMVAAIAGAVVGDSTGYEIGRRWGPALRASRLGLRIGEERWSKAETSLRRLGGRAVFVGRFVLVARALVPAAAGEAGVPYRSFLVWNVAGAVLWGTLHVGIGYVAGGSYAAAERVVGRLTWGLVGLLVLAGLAVHLWRRRAARAGAGE